MRLVFFQKRLRLAIEHERDNTLIYIDGKSEFFQHAFKDELDALTRGLEESLSTVKLK